MEVKDILYPNLIIDERNNYYMIQKHSNNGEVFLKDAIAVIYKNNKQNYNTQENIKSIMGDKYDGDNTFKDISPVEILKDTINKINSNNSPLKITTLEELKKDYQITFLNPWD